MTLNLKENKEKFIQIYKGEITRPGAAELLEKFIEKTDFFTAPFSSQFVLSVPGGLCQHSLHTYKVLVEMVEKYRAIDPYYLLDVTSENSAEEYQAELKQVDESIAIIGLLHSICLADSWVAGVRNEKQPDGKWKAIPINKWDEKFMFGGRGGKSVFILQQYIRLFVEEAQAIRFHMQGKEIPYGENFESTFYQVYEACPLAALTGVAVNEATNILDQMLWLKIKPE